MSRYFISQTAPVVKTTRDFWSKYVGSEIKLIRNYQIQAIGLIEKDRDLGARVRVIRTVAGSDVLEVDDLAQFFFCEACNAFNASFGGFNAPTEIMFDNMILQLEKEIEERHIAMHLYEDENYDDFDAETVEDATAALDAKIDQYDQHLIDIGVDSKVYLQKLRKGKSETAAAATAADRLDPDEYWKEMDRAGTSLRDTIGKPSFGFVAVHIESFKLSIPTDALVDGEGASLHDTIGKGGDGGVAVVPIVKDDGKAEAKDDCAGDSGKGAASTLTYRGVVFRSRVRGGVTEIFRDKCNCWDMCRCGGSCATGAHSVAIPWSASAPNEGWVTFTPQ
jgi:hypothetical protein